MAYIARRCPVCGGPALRVQRKYCNYSCYRIAARRRHKQNITDPTLLEIQELSAEIRDGWSIDETLERMGTNAPKVWMVPVVSVGL